MLLKLLCLPLAVGLASGAPVSVEEMVTGIVTGIDPSPSKLTVRDLLPGTGGLVIP